MNSYRSDNPVYLVLLLLFVILVGLGVLGSRPSGTPFMPGKSLPRAPEVVSVPVIFSAPAPEASSDPAVTGAAPSENPAAVEQESDPSIANPQN